MKRENWSSQHRFICSHSLILLAHFQQIHQNLQPWTLTRIFINNLLLNLKRPLLINKNKFNPQLHNLTCHPLKIWHQWDRADKETSNIKQNMRIVLIVKELLYLLNKQYWANIPLRIQLNLNKIKKKKYSPLWLLISQLKPLQDLIVKIVLVEHLHQTINLNWRNTKQIINKIQRLLLLMNQTIRAMQPLQKIPLIRSL
jgi:hypothetical protein